MLSENKSTIEIQGKPFPCPLCNVALPVAISQKGKPYCICNSCGIQLFFRGKAGIKKLQELLENQEPIHENQGISIAVSLYNRLQQLESQRAELEQKQGIIFRDENLDNAIAVLDAEIKKLESELRKISKEAEKQP